MTVAIIQLLLLIATLTITLYITGTDISIRHIHINHTSRINQMVDMLEENQVEAVSQLADQAGRGRELAGQEPQVVQEQVWAADANIDRKIKK